MEEGDAYRPRGTVNADLDTLWLSGRMSSARCQQLPLPTYEWTQRILTYLDRDRGSLGRFGPFLTASGVEGGSERGRETGRAVWGKVRRWDYVGRRADGHSSRSNMLLERGMSPEMFVVKVEFRVDVSLYI